MEIGVVQILQDSSRGGNVLGDTAERDSRTRKALVFLYEKTTDDWKEPESVRICCCQSVSNGSPQNLNEGDSDG